MYAHRLRTEGGLVYGRVVWFQWEGCEHTKDGGVAAAELRAWVAAQSDDLAAHDVQPASGIYVTLGTGAMPGANRHGPFSRANPHRTDMVEPVLTRLNSAVGSVLRAAFGQELDGWLVSGTATACQGGVADAATCESVPWNYMLQYPRVPAGEHGPLDLHTVSHLPVSCVSAACIRAGTGELPIVGRRGSASFKFFHSSDQFFF